MGLPELETKCWRCWGTGVVSVGDHSDALDCPECGGIGWVPTEEGKRLLEFLQRHLAIYPNEQDEDV